MATLALPAGGEVDPPAGVALALVVEGRVAVVAEAEGGRARTLALVQEGDLLLLPSPDWPGGPRTRWRAAVASRVLPLSRDQLDRWTAEPEVAARLVRALGAQVADRELAAAIALEPRVERRLLLKLRQLAERWGRVTPDGIKLDLRLTHQELADMVGAARESITLALGRLQDQGEIEVRRGAILIRTR